MSLTKPEFSALIAVDAMFFALIYIALVLAKTAVMAVASTSTNERVSTSMLSITSLVVSAALTTLLHVTTSRSKEFLKAIKSEEKKE